MRASAIDYSDIQGLVRFGYAHLTEACFFLLEVADPAAARSWLAAAPVTTAVKGQPPETTLQVGFTREGLEALKVPQAVIDGFSLEFISGMAGEASRSRRLGDVGASAPSEWSWGGPGRVPHVVVMLYAKQGLLAGWKQTVQGGWGAAFEVLDCLSAATFDGVEPFGFKDGISQPKIDWNRERKLDGNDQLEYGNLLSVGEFLLGYPNEYGKYTDRPLIDPKDDVTAQLSPAEDAPGKRDLGRNGTYMVLRQLRQEVRGFWQFLYRQSGSDPREAQRLGAAVLGRTLEGEPLIPATDHRIPGVGPEPQDISYNQFTYTSDSAGVRCPFGAHARRANPRNADLPAGTKGLLSRLIRTLGFGIKSSDDRISSTRFHRLLRRGRDYGTQPSLEAALDPEHPDSGECGLHFIGLNANIARQFEFVQNAWIMDTKFGGLTEESDLLLGNRAPVPGCPFTNTFSIPREGGVRRRITGVPQFVTVRGGAYFFLPGIRALRYLASAGG